MNKEKFLRKENDGTQLPAFPTGSTSWGSKSKSLVQSVDAEPKDKKGQL